MDKVVIDTNLLIDGSEDDYNHGNRIVDEVLAGRLTAFANRPTINENKLIARRKISDQEYLNKLERFFEAINLVDLPAERLNIVEDEEDNKLLESAVAAGADYLVSSDRHLLSIGEYQGVKIVPPSGFWSAYQENSDMGWESWLNNFIK